MNNQRRKEISKIKNELECLKEKINSIMDDEQLYYDNMPENLQGSIRGTDSEDSIENLSNAIDEIDESINYLEMIN